MLITAVEPRRKGLSQLYIDGECAVKLDTETLIANKIIAGAEISDEELHELIKKSEARRASEKALYLLELRDHSKKELADKIARTAGREAAKEAAEHMEELGLVNDDEFARKYARELFERKMFGKNRVRQELYLKGIDRDTVANILEELDFDPTENIRAVLERKYPSYGSDEAVKRRAFAALQRMGYRFDEIKRALTIDEEY